MKQDPTPQQEHVLAVLAAQLGLVSPDQAAHAIAQSCETAQESLLDRWVAQGILTAAQCAELQAKSGVRKADVDSAAGCADTLALADHPQRISQLETLPAASAPGSLGILSAEVTAEARGRYDVRSEHARGGQARVMRVWDRHLAREVACKEILVEGGYASSSADGSNTQAAEARFVREARITGALEHPNIVPIHELGRRVDGSLYYTMRLVRGETLTARLAKCTSLTSRLKLLKPFWDLCNAITFAHSQGVIHRDLKPDNVMVGAFGETVVLDWGLAKVRGGADERAHHLERNLKALGGAASTETMVGTALGTPAYMSPEQANGLIDEIDERSDVWGLGAVLYEIITGRPPFQARMLHQLLAQVRSDPVRPAAELQPDAPPELVAIAAKALERDKAKRYPSAQRMTDDVEAFMTGARVGAHEYRSWELLARFAKRNKAAIGALAAVFAVTVIALVVVSVQYRRAVAAHLREQSEHNRSHLSLAQAYVRQAERLADQKLYLSARIYAAASLLNNPAHPSLAFAPDFAASEPLSARLRVEATSVAWRGNLRRLRSRTLSAPCAEDVHSLAYSPDAARLYAGDSRGALLVLDPSRGITQTLRGAHKDRISSTTTSQDGSVVMTAGYDGKIKLWSPAPSAPLLTVDVPGAMLSSAALSGDKKHIAAGDTKGNTRLFDGATGAQLWSVKPHDDQVFGIAFSPDSRWVATACWDKTGLLLDAQTGKVRVRLTGHNASVYDVVFSPDGKRLATTSYDKTARIWDVDTGRLLATLEGHSDVVAAVAWSKDGTLIATGDQQGTVNLWDGNKYGLLEGIQGSLAVFDLALSPDGRSVAFVGHGKRIDLWTIAPTDGLLRLVHPDYVWGMAYSPDGKAIATGSEDSVVRLWDATQGVVLREFAGRPGAKPSVAFSADGSVLAAGSMDGGLQAWDLATGSVLPELQAHRGPVWSIAFSGRPNRIASGSRDGEVLLQDLSTRQVVARFSLGDRVYGLAVSPDGRLLAVACNDSKVWLFDLETQATIAKLAGHSDAASGVVFSSDGRYLGSSGKDGLALLWDVGKREIVHRYSLHKGWVSLLDISRDGTRLATAGDDHFAALWDVRTGEPRLTITQPTAVAFATFSPEGKRLAVQDNQSVVVFPIEGDARSIDPKSAIEEGQNESGMVLREFDLTPAEP